jgi:mannose-6-phosphate isomerase
MTISYPVRLNYVYKEAVWGGSRMKTILGLDSDLPHQAEGWALTVRDDGENTLAQGKFTGTLLSAADPSAKKEDFPLLIKYIDAGDKLSIQVHPAKTEFWYIVDCAPDSWLIYGQNGDYSEEQLREALGRGELESCLRRQPVKPGECYFIPTGLTHAIGDNILIAEIQENSNITYRVYDYDRPGIDGRPRELHTDKAFSVMKNFSEEELESLRFSVPYELPEEQKETSAVLASCNEFTVVKHSLTEPLANPLAIKAGGEFSHLLIIGGEGAINGEPCKSGESWYIPAAAGEVWLTPKKELVVLESFRLQGTN